MSGSGKFAPIGTTPEGKPIYDRTGVDMYPKKPTVQEKDGKPLCAFGGGEGNCTQRRMKGYEFCVKHILQDPTAPFKKCEYNNDNPSGKKCNNPVKIDQDDARYCQAHKQKLGVAPKGQAGYSKKNKVKAEGTTPSKRGRKKESVLNDADSLSETSEMKDTTTVIQTDKSLPQTTTGTTTNTATISSSAPTNISLDAILPYPYEITTNNNDDTDSDEFTGITRSFDPRKELPSKPKKPSPIKKRKRKFSRQLSKSDSFLGSETESDEPTDDEECKEETYLYSTQGRNDQQCLSEMEFLRIRKHHIESLLGLYQNRHRKIRRELERKYNEFLIQREVAANLILEQTQQNQNMDVKIRLKKVNYSNYYNPKNRVNSEHDMIVLPTVNFPPENQQAYHCEKVEKYHEVTKEPLCSHAQCFNKRMLGLEFCFQHILYDQNQRLYVPSTSSTPTYALSSETSIKIPKESTLTERTVVVIENATKFNATNTNWNVSSEQEQLAQRLFRKIRGLPEVEEVIPNPNTSSNSTEVEDVVMDTSTATNQL